MNIHFQANRLYQAVKSIDGIAATIETERGRLGLELATGGDLMEVTSWTMNGQSAAGELTATRSEQLAILELVAHGLAHGGIPNPSISRPRFA